MELARFTRLVDAWKPGARAVAVEVLTGGVSGTTEALTWEDGDGQRGEVVVRRPGPGTTGDAGAALRQQAVAGEAARGAGIAVPRLLFLDASGECLGEPAFIVERTRGEPKLHGLAEPACVAQMAETLAALHAIVGNERLLPPCPDPRAQYLSAIDGEGPQVLRAADLVGAWAGWCCAPQRLLHGDFWPGNLLWRGERLVAVIDWEEAVIGDPLRDLALSRLDLWWLAGEDAADALATHYATVVGGIDWQRLAFWELWAALRPLGKLERWAVSYPARGRPDVTPTTMRRDLEAFLATALERFTA